MCSWVDELNIASDEQMILQIINKYQEQKGSKHRALQHTGFYGV